MEQTCSKKQPVASAYSMMPLENQFLCFFWFTDREPVLLEQISPTYAAS